MNIVDSETIFDIDAKVSGRKDKRNVIYSFVERPYNLYIDKKEIILAQLHACEQLLNYFSDSVEINVINKEIAGLKASLEVLAHYGNNNFE